MKRTVKFGIFGLGRGSTFYKVVLANNGEIVAVCDRNEKKLAKAKEQLGNDLVTYTDFEEFLNHDGLEAIFLCNNFNQHVPFAIKALEKGIHVLSECTSNSTMAEGVALVRAAERSKAIYMLSENYPFMIFNKEMRRVFRGGSLGKLLYAEGEYNHPVDPYGDKELKELRPYYHHWRNWLPRTYYVTHSLAPLMYITGAWPTRVTAMPVYAPFPEDSILSTGVQDRAAIITCLNNDDSVFRITGCAAFGAHENSYRICGVNGQIENVRGEREKVLLRYNKWNTPEGKEHNNTYNASWNDPDEQLIKTAGHGGGDFLVIREFFDCIREGRRPEFDVYFATTMASVGILAHRSLLERGVPYDIPDFRREEDRVKYENDHLSPFFGPNGEHPSIEACSHGSSVKSDEEIAAHEARLAAIED